MTSRCPIKLKSQSKSISGEESSLIFEKIHKLTSGGEFGGHVLVELLPDNGVLLALGTSVFDSGLEVANGGSLKPLSLRLESETCQIKFRNFQKN